MDHQFYFNFMPELKLKIMTGIFDIKGKVALVTGGSTGIGAMITEALVSAGAKVYISSRNAEVLENFATEMRKSGECIALPADLSSVDNIHELVKTLGEKEEKLDILINNSGASWGAPLGEFPEKGWDKVMNINVKSVFFLTQSLLPMLKASASAEDPSRVINISSIAAVSPNSISAYSYGPSKAAVAQLTKILASDLIKDQILVNAIAPGLFPSKMTAAWDPSMMVKHVPIGRVGRAADIAGLVIYLCSDAGSYMTGNYIPLDGGELVKANMF